MHELFNPNLVAFIETYNLHRALGPYVSIPSFEKGRSTNEESGRESIDTSAGLIPPMLYEVTIPCRVNFSSEIRENYQLP